MDATPRPGTSIVVMGVSGSGKTTVAVELARRLGWTFAEGDDLHPEANVAKMRAGIPLTDDDRWPWLRAVAAWIDEQEAGGTPCVVTCSALKRVYRDLLREENPSVWFAHVNVPEEVLVERLRERKGHFMPSSLLTSQLQTLEPLAEEEPGHAVPGDGSATETVDGLLAALARERDVHAPN